MEGLARARCLAAALALAVLGVQGCGCTSDPDPDPDPTRPPSGGAEGPTDLDPEDPEGGGRSLWRRPSSLNPDEGLEPRVASRLKDLERDYFGGQFAYVVQEAQDLLDMTAEDPQMRLRLYYLLARSHARLREPSEAQRYEELYRELYTRLRSQPPRSPKDAARLRGFVDRAEELHKDVHPAWNLDADGIVWANVRIWRRLDREGPHAVISEEHPGGGGVIHASLSRENLEAYLTDLGLLGGDAAIDKDARFGFFFLLQDEAPR